MTYAGLKSMIYAGLKQDDVRVKAAVGYIAKNYTVDENPGQGQRGTLLLLPYVRPGPRRPGATDARRQRGEGARLEG